MVGRKKQIDHIPSHGRSQEEGRPHAQVCRKPCVNPAIRTDALSNTTPESTFYRLFPKFKLTTSRKFTSNAKNTERHQKKKKEACCE